MELHIVERHSISSPAVREYVEKKVGVLQRYFDRITRMDVVLETEGSLHRTQIIAHLVNKKVVKAVGEDAEVLASVDQAVDKMQRQLVGFKERLRVMRKSGEASPTGRPPAQPQVEEVEDYVRKPFTLEEAVEYLEATGRDFLVFFEAGEDAPAVLFKKKDGRYGVIRPRL